MNRVVWTLVLATGLGGAGPAAAYVRAVSTAGAAWHWERTALTLRAEVADAPAPLTRVQALAGAREAAGAWSRGQRSCTDVVIDVTAGDETSAPTVRDGVNRIVFRRVSWCPDDLAPGEACHDPGTLALTTNAVHVQTGKIVEADIEVNAVDATGPAWANLVERPDLAAASHDLQNVLTHEIGHFLGFAHTCLLSAADRATTDDAGNPVPRCEDATGAARESTMFASARPGNLSLRSLEPDDVRSLRRLPAGDLAGARGARRGRGLLHRGTWGRAAVGDHPDRRPPPLRPPPCLSRARWSRARAR